MDGDSAATELAGLTPTAPVGELERLGSLEARAAVQPGVQWIAAEMVAPRRPRCADGRA